MGCGPSSEGGGSSDGGMPGNYRPSRYVPNSRASASAVAPSPPPAYAQQLVNSGAGASGAADASGGGGGGRRVTRAELAQHASPGSAWVCIFGLVYDVTRFAREHPGGEAAILGSAGTDATAIFKESHGSNVRPHERLRGCLVGRLE